MQNNKGTSETDYQLIESYFSFELNQEQLLHFEKRLENDAVFRHRVIQFKKIDASVQKLTSPQKTTKEAIKKQWKAQLQVSKNSLEKPRSIFHLTSFLKIAVAVLFLVIGGYIFQQLNQTASMPDLAEKYWQTSAKNSFSFLNTKSSGLIPEKDSLIRVTYQTFKNKQYAKTIALLKDMEKDSSHYIVLLLQGESYLGLQKPDQAINIFQKLIDQTGSPGKDDALWFQALAYLKLEQADLAIANLKLIIENNYPRTETAKDLLDKIINN